MFVVRFLVRIGGTHEYLTQGLWVVGCSYLAGFLEVLANVPEVKHADIADVHNVCGCRDRTLYIRPS